VDLENWHVAGKGKKGYYAAFPNIFSTL